MKQKSKNFEEKETFVKHKIITIINDVINNY